MCTDVSAGVGVLTSPIIDGSSDIAPAVGHAELTLPHLNQDPVRLQEIHVKDVTERTPVTQTGRQNTSSCQDGIVLVIHPVDRSVNWSQSVDSRPEEEAIMQISGAGHWFLEGWIGDHGVDFLVDSGSAVTALSSSFYKNPREVGAPVGEIRPTIRRLRGANGSRIDIMGCSFCVVSFLGHRNRYFGIIGTDILGSVLPHKLDIKHGLLFTEGGVYLQLHRRDAALS